MPLEVHCPNPACAKIHLVKSKYAGMRGKCPACQSWMYIPNATTTAIPSMANFELPSAIEAPPPSKPARAPVVSEPEPVEELAPFPEPKRARPVSRVCPPEEISDVATLSEADVTEDQPTKPARHFSWLAVLFLLFAMLSLGLMMSSPFLPGPSVEGSGKLAEDLPKPKGIEKDDDVFLTVIGIPGGVAFLVFLALLPALFLRRLGFINLFFIYLAMLGSSFLLFAALHGFTRDTKQLAQTESTIEYRKAKGVPGEATASLGYQHHALVGGAGGACVFLLLAGLLAHKRLWSRLLGFLVLGFLPALAVAWVFRKPLGIDVDLPFDVPTW